MVVAHRQGNRSWSIEENLVLHLLTSVDEDMEVNGNSSEAVSTSRKMLTAGVML